MRAVPGLVVTWIIWPGTVLTAVAASPTWKVTGAVTSTTGTYGTGTRTTVFSTPVTLTREFGVGDLSLTVPYLAQETSTLVTVVGGNPVQIRPRRGAVSTTTQSGLGDLILKGRYFLLEENGQPVDLNLMGKIKVPTADKDKGLGTGQFDEGVGLEFDKRLNPDWTLFADAAYTWIGSPPGTPLENQAAFDLGVGNQLYPSLTVTVFYEESTPLLKGSPNPRDLAATFTYAVEKMARLFAGWTVGLSEGSPDLGVSAGGSVRW